MMTPCNNYSVDKLPYSNGNNVAIEDIEAKGNRFLTGFGKTNLLSQLKTFPSKHFFS